MCMSSLDCAKETTIKFLKMFFSCLGAGVAVIAKARDFIHVRIRFHLKAWGPGSSSNLCNHRSAGQGKHEATNHLWVPGMDVHPT